MPESQVFGVVCLIISLGLALLLVMYPLRELLSTRGKGGSLSPKDLKDIQTHLHDTLSQKLLKDYTMQAQRDWERRHYMRPKSRGTQWLD